MRGAPRLEKCMSKIFEQQPFYVVLPTKHVSCHKLCVYHVTSLSIDNVIPRSFAESLE